MVLVDTTVWIDLLRGRETVGALRLRDLLSKGSAAVAPVIVQELVQGASSAPNAEALRSHFLALPLLSSPDVAGAHARAGILYARCRWHGLAPRSPHDCLIAQAALDHDVSLLHNDRDFELIAEVEPRLTLIRD